MADAKHPGMTNAEFEELGSYVRWMGDAMGLRDWRFDLMHGVPQDDGVEDIDALARIVVTYGRRHAQITVCRDFRNLQPDRQRATIAHELVHCHFEHCAITARELKPMIGGMIYEVWYESAFHLGVENGVDAIAEAWAMKLPMIAWPKPKVKAERGVPVKAHTKGKGRG